MSKILSLLLSLGQTQLLETDLTISEMGIRLAANECGDPLKREELRMPPLQSLGGVSPLEYSDACRGVQKGAYPIQESYAL